MVSFLCWQCARSQCPGVHCEKFGLFPAAAASARGVCWHWRRQHHPAYHLWRHLLWLLVTRSLLAFDIILSTTAEQQCSIIAVSLKTKAVSRAGSMIWNKLPYDIRTSQSKHHSSKPSKPICSTCTTKFHNVLFPTRCSLSIWWLFCVAPFPFLLFCVIVICYSAVSGCFVVTVVVVLVLLCWSPNEMGTQEVYFIIIKYL